MGTTKVTTLMSNQDLAFAERMRLSPIRKLTNKLRGEHLAGRGGSSITFSDYRDYVPGDDTRFVDWNIFARLRRPYLKLYAEEERALLLIIVDTSESMMFDGKIELALSLAAAFGVMGLRGEERVGVYVSGGPAQGGTMKPVSGRGGMRQFFHFIENAPKGGSISFDAGVLEAIKRHRGKGMAVLLSDFLTFGDVAKPLNALFSIGLEPFAIQILAPEEYDPELVDDFRLVDSESHAALDVTAGGDILDIYREHRDHLAGELDDMCRNRSGRFVSITSDNTLKNVMSNVLLRGGWIKAAK